jgi:hypothetical protein
MSDSALEQSIFSDMTNLEKSLSEDTTGEKARNMVTYFRSIVEATDKMLATVRDESQRHLVSRLLQGFQAAERIIRHVWETIHGVALVL